jgi:hypothetical protein
MLKFGCLCFDWALRSIQLVAAVVVYAPALSWRSRVNEPWADLELRPDTRNKTVKCAVAPDTRDCPVKEESELIL